MSDAARADHVRAVVEGNFGRNGNTMDADVSIGLNAIWGEGGSRKCQPR